MDLYRRSIQVTLRNQADSGAYVASPNFPPYIYCWLRDGSFIAYAMDRAGEHGSAAAFFRWVNRTIQRHAWKVDRLLNKLEKGQLLEDSDYLHTRYTLDGEEAESQWWNFQLDGYGTWLWALAEHLAITGDRSLLGEMADSIHITVRYLSALWAYPNYDCWEEHPHYIHPYTLAAIYAGLRAADAMGMLDAQSSGIVADIRRFMLAHGVWGGHVVKYINPEGEMIGNGSPRSLSESEESTLVDASLIGIATPYRLLSPTDPLMQATVACIESNLHRSGGGVYRYTADTYYGGGEWVLLAAWLGWYYTEVGQWKQAQDLLDWVEAQADTDGYLPEQVSSHPLSPHRLAEWQARWGSIAKPLLWSHAMHIILYSALKKMGRS